MYTHCVCCFIMTGIYIYIHTHTHTYDYIYIYIRTSYQLSGSMGPVWRNIFLVVFYGYMSLSWVRDFDKAQSPGRGPAGWLFIEHPVLLHVSPPIGRWHHS